MKLLRFVVVCILLHPYHIYTLRNMGKEEIRALTIPEIQALTIEDIEGFDSIETFLRELSIPQTKALKPDIIGDLSLDIQYFMPDQIRAFTPEQTASITADQILLLDRAQIQQLSFQNISIQTLQILASNPTRGKLTSLTEAQIQSLSFDQIILLLPQLTLEQANFILDRQHALFSTRQKQEFNTILANKKFKAQYEQQRREYEEREKKVREEAEAKGQQTPEAKTVNWFDLHKEIMLKSIQEFFKNVALKDFAQITFNHDLLQAMISKFPQLERFDRAIVEEKLNQLTNTLLGRYRSTRDWVRNLRDKNSIKNDILEIKRQNPTASIADIFTILKNRNVSKLRDALNDPLMLQNKIEAVVKGWIANPESATPFANKKMLCQALEIASSLSTTR